MTDDLDLTEEHDRIRIDLGGYVLGGLTLAEQQAVEAHLETCDACQAELAELDSVPVLLDLARSDGTAPATEPTPSAPARSGRRNRVLVGAAAAVAIVMALTVGLLVASPDDPTFGPTIALESAAGLGTEAGGPSGTAALRPTDHGTVVRLDLERLSDGSWYECTWWSPEQGNQSAGTFRPAPDGTVHVDLTTAARAYPGWRLQILEHSDDEPDGEAVLEASA